ncbi:MAG: hypothetical protein F4Z17_07585 [Acidimicrobiia bacterium]|nr:hypothetical protein [Acidimicrobiia bacterium]MYB45333.1 hypothetical protein [Acidimicrobiia bacterium]
MRTARLTLLTLAAVVLSSGCDGTVTEAEHPTSTTLIEVEDSTSTTSKVEECSWCPATDTSATTVGRPASQSPDLMDRLASETTGTAFAGLTEDEVRSDISGICGAGEGGASRQGAAAEMARHRATRMEMDQSAPGVASYAQLLETEADRRCA